MSSRQRAEWSRPAPARRPPHTNPARPPPPADAGGLNNYELVSEAFNQIQRTLLEFCVNFYSHVPVSSRVLRRGPPAPARPRPLTVATYPAPTLATQDKFNRLMGVLPDLRAIAVRGEDFLYFKHRAGLAPSKTLLMEMLHAKRRA